VIDRPSLVCEASQGECDTLALGPWPLAPFNVFLVACSALFSSASECTLKSVGQCVYIPGLLFYRCP
jgi:hypothetical protein